LFFEEIRDDDIKATMEIVEEVRKQMAKGVYECKCGRCEVKDGV